MKIRSKFLLLMLSVLLPGTALTMAWQYYSSSRAVISLASKNNSAFSSSVVSAVTALMKSGRHEHLNEYLADVRHSVSIAEVQFVRSRSMEEQMGPTADNAAVDYLDRLVLTTGKQTTKELSLPSGRAIRTVTPFVASAACLSCHKGIKVGDIIAALSITHSFQSGLDDVMYNMIIIGVICGLVILISSSLIMVFVNKGIVRPLSRLQVAIVQLSSGDWSAARSLLSNSDNPEPDGLSLSPLNEIAALSVSLQEMARGLQDVTVSRDALAGEIEERSRIETAFQNSFILLAEQSRTVLWESDDTGLFTHVNNVAQAVFGYRREEMIGKMNLCDLYPKEGGEDAKKEAVEILERHEEREAVIQTMQKENGERVVVVMNIVPVVNSDGGREGYRGSFIDVTERQAREDTIARQLKEMETYIAAIGEREKRILELKKELGQLRDGVKDAQNEYHRFKALVQEPPLLKPVAQDGQRDKASVESLPTHEILAGILDDNRQMQVRLEYTERSLELILSAAGDGILGLNADGMMVFVNARAAEMLGYSEAELVGRDIHSIWNHSRPDDKSYPYHECPTFQVLKDGQSHYWEDSVWRKDGIALPVAIGSAPLVEEGMVTGIVLSFRDRTDLIQSEQAVLELRNITDFAKDAIMMMNPRGEITFWNKAATKIFGYKADEALGKNLHQLIAPERFCTAHAAAFPDFLRTGHGAAIGKTIEVTGLHKDGGEFPIDLSLTGFHRKDGWNAIGVIRDVSDRKKAQADIAENIREMERFNNLMFEREHRVMEIKHEVNLLLAELGREKKYGVVKKSPYALAAISWNEDYSVGVKLIDEQHKEFHLLLHSLSEALADDNDRVVVNKMFKHIVENVLNHFNTEESYMEKFHFDGYEGHKKDHEAFKGMVEALMTSSVGEEEVISEETVEYIREWFKDHIAAMDKKYVNCFHEHGIY